MKDSEVKKSWYEELADIYTSEQRKNWYSEVADAYNRVRPRYPKEIICRAIELSQLVSDALVLEVGCGPAIATIPFAQFGFSMFCLEPSWEACQLALQNCAPYPNVEIANTTFEEWQLEPKKFNALLAATSFHWISPEIAHPKAAAALKDNGSLILLWNTPPQPEYEVYQVLHEVYETFAPSLAGYEDRSAQEKLLIRFGEKAIESGYFEGLFSEKLTIEVNYTIDDYLALLSTLTPYIKLESQQRISLFQGLREALEKPRKITIKTSYLSVLQVAKKI